MRPMVHSSNLVYMQSICAVGKNLEEFAMLAMRLVPCLGDGWTVGGLKWSRGRMDE